MRKPLRSLAIAAVVLTVAGCAGQSPKVGMGPPPSGREMLMSQARQALGAQNGDAAVSFAELAVRSSPGDAGARKLLAQAYLAAGRLRSAVDAYDDLLALKPGDADAGLKRAVTLLASGDRAAALEALAGAKAPPADVGLAYALAGDSDAAIAMLTEAARSPGATPRVRQNLALAHALAGHWAQARTVAAQDLAPELVDARIAEWSQLASVDAPVRTQTMLAVAPAEEDGGRPVELAYGYVPAPVQQMAEAQAAKTPAEAVSAPQEAPPLVRVALTTPRAPEGWVVQLGAFSQPELVDKAWSEIVAGTVHLVETLAPVRSTVTVAGHVLHRLSVGGFASHREAGRLCDGLRAQGNDCYVRRSERDGLVRLAETTAVPGA